MIISNHNLKSTKMSDKITSLWLTRPHYITYTNHFITKIHISLLCRRSYLPTTNAAGKKLPHPQNQTKKLNIWIKWQIPWFWKYHNHPRHFREGQDDTCLQPCAVKMDHNHWNSMTPSPRTTNHEMRKKHHIFLPFAV